MYNIYIYMYTIVECIYNIYIYIYTIRQYIHSCVYIYTMMFLFRE